MSNTIRFPAHRARPPARPNLLASIWQAVARSWRLARANRPHDSMDDATLRDLGMSRSELDSYAAEAAGAVEATRLRVIASHGAGSAPGTRRERP